MFHGNMLLSKPATLKELRSIISRLNFACSVIIPGRVFRRRLINLTIGIKKPHYFIRLNTEVKKDWRIWQTFLDSFNGNSFFLDEGWSSSYSLCFHTDAVQSKGYGLIFWQTVGIWQVARVMDRIQHWLSWVFSHCRRSRHLVSLVETQASAFLHWQWKHCLCY